MNGDGRFHSMTGIRLLLLASVGCATAAAQAITLQSSLNGNPAANVTSITGGTSLPTGFTIYVNGADNTFDPAANQTRIVWNSLNTTNNPGGLIVGTVTANGHNNQVTGFVPQAFFQNPVSNTVQVLI